MLGSEKKLVWVRLDVRKKLGLVRFEKKVGQVGQGKCQVWKKRLGWVRLGWKKSRVRFGKKSLKKSQVGIGQEKKVWLGQFRL